jgi:uncharacterized protein YgbK (DUF1537 family)
LGSQALFFAAIADDDTGASDEAGMLAEAGARTILSIGLPSAGDLETWRAGYHAVVVATRSRHASPSEAYRLTRDAVALLRAAGVERFQVKYCSTFDSTGIGNIGPSLDAALDELDEQFTIAVPALPVNGRTTYSGHHFVNGVPLAESPMRHHPLTPMTDSNLVRWLGLQTRRRVGLAALSAVRAGDAALRAEFDHLRVSGVEIALVDCTEQQDLAAIARAALGLRLTSGASGLAMEFPALWRNAGRLRSVSREGENSLQDMPEGSLLVAGSCSEATARQNGLAAESGIAVVPLDPMDVIDGRVESAPIRRRLAAGEAVLLTTTCEPPAVAAIQARAAARGWTPELLGERLAAATAALTAGLLADSGVRRLVVAGGETAGHVCRALGIRSLEVLANIDPGVPLCRAGALLVALKSGNFGAPYFYRKALERMDLAAAGRLDTASGPA